MSWLVRSSLTHIEKWDHPWKIHPFCVPKEHFCIIYSPLVGIQKQQCVPETGRHTNSDTKTNITSQLKFGRGLLWPTFSGVRVNLRNSFFTPTVSDFNKILGHLQKRPDPTKTKAELIMKWLDQLYCSIQITYINANYNINFNIYFSLILFKFERKKVMLIIWGSNFIHLMELLLPSHKSNWTGTTKIIISVLYPNFRIVGVFSKQG